MTDKTQECHNIVVLLLEICNLSQYLICIVFSLYSKLYLSLQKRRSLRDTSLRFSGRNLSSSSFDGKALKEAGDRGVDGGGERRQGTFLTAEF